jgi:hypothetical protein
MFDWDKGQRTPPTHLSVSTILRSLQWQNIPFAWTTVSSYRTLVFWPHGLHHHGSQQIEYHPNINRENTSQSTVGAVIGCRTNDDDDDDDNASPMSRSWKPLSHSLTERKQQKHDTYWGH